MSADTLAFSIEERDDGVYLRLDGEEVWHGPYASRDAAIEHVKGLIAKIATKQLRSFLNLK